MKKIVFFSLICLMALNVNAQWVDLGLPSGTLWKDKNEEGGFYKYDEAACRFGNSLPTKEQVEELKTKCQWTWTGSGHKVVGPNGRSIYLPAAGYRSCSGNVYHVGSRGNYWSSTPYGSYGAWYLYFGSDGVNMIDDSRCSMLSVRLVQDVEVKYVDLGLPSGTLWKNKNEEGGTYTYDQAVSKFGSALPTKEQSEELKNSCRWTWTGNGYKVVGPNGQSIFLHAAGIRSCVGRLIDVGTCGDYWSSTPKSSDDAFSLSFSSRERYVSFSPRCFELSVRVVQNAEVEAKYVDLGLPSGTLWKDNNEDKGLYTYYTYDQAVSKFGSALPTKEQFEELKNSCQWTWTGNGYKVVGPNGKSIFLPAAGYRSCDGDVNFVGYYGYYWSYTPSGSDKVWDLDFYSGEVRMDDSRRCYGYSVCLVKNK